MPDPAQMWATYAFRGHRVTVIQQWTDPFGRRMVRVALVGDEDAAEGFAEAEFLREATLCAAP